MVSFFFFFPYIFRLKAPCGTYNIALAAKEHKVPVSMHFDDNLKKYPFSDL